MSNITQRLEDATAKAENASAKLHEVVHGDASTEVVTETGNVPSLAKWFGDLNAQMGDVAAIPMRLSSLETFLDDLSDAVDPAHGAKKVGYKGATVADELDELSFLKMNASAHSHRMELIAHRGFREQMPENTILALSRAGQLGADSLECDVQISSDGVPLVFHDLSVQNLTTGTGAFKDLSSSTLTSLSFKSTAGTIYASVRIPRFAEVLSLAKRRGMYLYPEIKGYRTQEDIDLIVGEIVSAGMAEQCLLQSFTFSDLEYVRSLNDRIAVGFLGTATTGYEAAIDSLAELGRSALLWKFDSLLAAPEIVGYCRERGVDVVAWTVNSDADARALMEIGVRRIMSDITLGGR